MILPKLRDKRLITVRRGGTLSEADHHLLAVWAAHCAQHVLHHFEQARPGDDRPHRAIAAAHAWANGQCTMMQARAAAGASQDAAREVKAVSESARLAALAAGQAAVVSHVAAHELGAAAYAIRAAMAVAPAVEREAARQREWQWQRNQLPDCVRDLVLDDAHLRNDICWFAFTLD